MSIASSPSATDTSAAPGHAVRETAPSPRDRHDAFAQLFAAMALSSYADADLSKQVRLNAFIDRSDLDAIVGPRFDDQRFGRDHRSREATPEKPTPATTAAPRETADNPEARAPTNEDRPAADGRTDQARQTSAVAARPMSPPDTEGPTPLDVRPTPPAPEPATGARRAGPGDATSETERTKSANTSPQRTGATPIKAQVEGARQPVSLPSTTLSAPASLTAQNTDTTKPATPPQPQAPKASAEATVEPPAHGLATAVQRVQRTGRGLTQAATTPAGTANANAQTSPTQGMNPIAAMLPQAVASTPETRAVLAGYRQPSVETGWRPITQPGADGLFGSGQLGGNSAQRLFAPAQAAKPHPQLPPRFISQQVAVQIQKAFAHGTDRITIQLKPADLGRVDVRLDVGQDSRVSVAISTDRPDTLDLLQRDARALQTALQEAGLRADADSLSFSLRQQQAGSGEPGGEAPAGGSEQAAGAAADIEAETPQPRHLIAEDHVDISV